MSVPFARLMLVYRRFRCPIPFMALASFSFDGSVICPFTFEPIGTMILPAASCTGAVTVAVKRSPILDVLVDSGVSRFARIVVPAEILRAVVPAAEMVCACPEGSLDVLGGGVSLTAIASGGSAIGVVAGVSLGAR